MAPVARIAAANRLPPATGKEKVQSSMTTPSVVTAEMPTATARARL